jgi:hypothetical protein
MHFHHEGEGSLVNGSNTRKESLNQLAFFQKDNVYLESKESLAPCFSDRE